MSTTPTNYWKRLWRWTTSDTLGKDELLCVLGSSDVIIGLRQGLNSYKPNKAETFLQLKDKYSDQTRLLNVIQTLLNYVDIDCFQLWDIVKHYLCDISYGTPANALKNVAFVDTRPSFLLPNVWNFYFAERLFLLKLLQYIIENKENGNFTYHEQFKKIFNNIGVEELKKSLISQFEKVLSSAPPPRKIVSEFSSDTVRQEWAESNLREQLAILQNLLLLVHDYSFSENDFTVLFELFRKHSFGTNQGYKDLLEVRNREACLRIMYMEISIFMVILDSNKISNLPCWIEKTKEIVEYELTKLHINTELTPMLLSWMLFTLKSEKHAQLFESQYQHYGATALKLHVFEFLNQMLNNSMFSDNSKCAVIVRKRIFQLLNELCDRFDGDGTLSHQPGAMKLCAILLKDSDIASQFWELYKKEMDFGVVSMWNTALEYFPYNFSALSTLAAGLAQSGKSSVKNLLAELKNLPVYTEIYNPNAVPITSLQSDDAVIGRDYYPLGDPSYRIEAGSVATIMERKEGTMIHFRTPYSYWNIYNSEIENALDKKGNNYNNEANLQRIYEGTKVLKGMLSQEELVVTRTTTS